MVAYAEDNEKAFRYLTVAEYPRSRVGLRELAVENLARITPKFVQHVLNEHVSIISLSDSPLVFRNKRFVKFTGN